MMANCNRLYEMRYLIMLTIGHKHFNGDATSIFETVSFWLVSLRAIVFPGNSLISSFELFKIRAEMGHFNFNPNLDKYRQGPCS